MSAGMNGGSAAFRIAAVPSGRRMKYVLVVLWLVVIAVGGTLAGKLRGAEKNDSSAWLSAKTESTQALNVQDRFVSKNVFPAVVVYQRATGLTQADRAKTASDARGFAAVAGAGGRVTGPVQSRDGKAVQTIVSADLGNDGWNGAATFVDSIRKVAATGADG